METNDTTQLFLQQLLRAEAKLYSYIRSQVSRRVDAEEILQDTVAVLWSKFEQFEPGSDFLAWAYQVARYKVMYFHRQRKSHGITFSSEFIETVADCAEQLHEETSDMEDALVQCLKKLRDADRDIFRRCYATDATIASVARQVNRPIATIKAVLKRSRLTLFDCIQRVLRNETS